jgi:prolyl 4-hydroxylase
VDYTLTPLGADIFVVKGLLDVTLCQHILQVVNCYHFQAAGIEVATVNAQIRSNALLSLDSTDGLLQSTHQLLLTRIGVIQQLLLQHYDVAFPHAEACSILRYQPGQYYKRHIDNLLLSDRFEEVAQGVPTRDISIVGYLNDDFEGGETFFDRQDLKVKPEAGSVLVFPAYYTHPHQSLPVLQGEKYSFTTWLFH